MSRASWDPARETRGGFTKYLREQLLDRLLVASQSSTASTALPTSDFRLLAREFQSMMRELDTRTSG